MDPAPGERLVRFVGDRIRFALRDGGGHKGWRALLRTNLGRAATLRREIIAAHAGGAIPAGASWRDLPMPKAGDGWQIELPLAETGYFKAKAYLLDPKGWQHWPDGPDIGISLHPNFARTANTIYCAFTRLFGATKKLPSTRDDKLEARLRQLEELGCAVIPPSGKLRDLARQLPHIVHTLSCRILHLLPVQPTPTIYARFGRFGSPYASLDLTAIDPALVEFDQRTTGVDQFCELTWAAHGFGARVFIDIVINHTGWGLRWPSQERYLNEDSQGVKHFPGISLEAARRLLEEVHPAGVGIDTLSIEHGPTEDFVVHRLVLVAGLYILENVANLESLPPTGALVIALPLKLVGGSGSPARVLALVPKQK